MPLVYLCHWIGIPVAPECEIDTAYDSHGAAQKAIEFHRSRPGANKRDKWQVHHFRKNKLGVYERIYHADDSQAFDTSGYEVVDARQRQREREKILEITRYLESAVNHILETVEHE
jgi:hypothetical protein